MQWARYVLDYAQREMYASASSLLSAISTVLQEDEFRHLIMPVDDRETAHALRITIHRKVTGQQEPIVEATAALRGRWINAAVTAMQLILAGVVGVAIAYDMMLRYVADILWGQGEATLPSALPLVLLVLGLIAWVLRSVLRTAASVGLDWDAAVANEVRPLIRVAINEFANETNPTRLLVENAPGLAEAAEPDRLVERRCYQDISLLTNRLGTTTVAVSGPRGVGKTTLLQRLSAGEDPEAGMSLIVAAPVTYDPRDFLIHLYAQLCDAVLKVAGARRHRFALPRFVSRILRALLIIVVLGCAIGVVAQSWVQQELADHGVAVSRMLLITVLIAVGVLALSMVPKAAPGTGDRSGGTIINRAEFERSRLRFLSTITAERGGTVGRWGLGFGYRAARQLAEQPVSLPELVASYRGFSHEVATWLRHRGGQGARLVVGIDEIDRIAEPADAERFLNSVKPVFGVPGCVYIITVSEEALARFERRLVGSSTAMASAFDETVRLGRFSLGESRQLLRRRVIGFPDAFVALSHCLSGGVPRDLVRMARAIVKIRVESERRELLDLTPLVIRAQLGALKQGLRTRVASAEAAGLLELLIDPAWPRTPEEPELWWRPGSPLLADLDDALRLAKDDALARTATDIVGAVCFYATVHDLCLYGGDAEAIDTLAGLHGLLSVDGQLCLRRLDDFARVSHVPIVMTNHDVGHGGVHVRRRGRRLVELARREVVPHACDPIIEMVSGRQWGLQQIAPKSW